MDDSQAFGLLLRRLRRAHGLTQATLAGQASCSTDTIKKVEAGVRRPSPRLAAQLANCLGLSAEERSAFLATALGSTSPTRGETSAIGWAAVVSEALQRAEVDKGDTGVAPEAARARTTHLLLPQQMTSFIGRGQEIALIMSLLSSVPSRLVTLTGAGGVGKTRLALQVASGLAEACPDYPDGVYWVELAALSDPLLVPEALAAALQLRLQAHPSVTEQLVGYLRSKATLLVLDNCEHLLDACSLLADTLLRACPAVRILATGREALGVAGETSHIVPSLDVPELPTIAGWGGALADADLRQLEETEAVCLFVERARSARPGFALTPQNASAVVQVCRRLDGIPLALELAAARVKLLRVDEIAAYLDISFGLLTGGGRRAPERHQTLRAAIDWSYDLLNDAERVLLRRLAVFAGGFTVEAAGAVYSGERLPEDMVFDGLARLVDKSLVVVSQEHQPTRYRLLEPVRQYARDKLSEAGEEEVLGYAHASFFLTRAEQAHPNLWETEHTTSLGWFRAEQDNLRSAVQWAVQHSDVTLGARLVQSLYWFWFLSGVMSEGRRLIGAVLALVDSAGSAEERAGVLRVAGHLTFLDGDDVTEARTQLEESAALYRQLGNKEGLVHCLNALSLALLSEGNMAGAAAAVAEGDILLREIGDKRSRSFLHVGLMVVAIEQGDYARVRAIGQESLARYRASGNQWGMAITLNHFGDAARCQGDYRAAEELYTRSQELFEKAGVQAESASVLHNLGYVALALGDPARARALFAKSLDLQRERGNRAGVLEALAGFAALLVVRGQPGRGAAVYGAVGALREAFRTPIWPAERIEGERYLAKMRAALGASALRAALAEGSELTLEQAITYALENLDRIGVTERQAVQSAWGGLTGREREVVGLVTQGKSNREIAAALLVTERTVETHINHIRSKLDLRSRAQIAVWAVERGLLEAKPPRRE